MATRTKSFRLSYDLATALELRAKRLGYASLSDMMKGLGRYDVLCQSSHGVTLEWSKLSLPEQDELDAKLLARALEGKGMKASEAAVTDWRAL